MTRKTLWNANNRSGAQGYITNQKNDQIIIDVDLENGYYWYVYAGNVYYTYDSRDVHFYNSGKITVYKATMPCGYYDLRKSTVIEATDYQIPVNFGNNADYWRGVWQSDALYLYHTNVSGNWNSSNKLPVVKVTKNGIERFEIDNLTGETLYVPEAKIRFCDGYMYTPRSSSGSYIYFDYTKIFKIRMSDSVLVDTFETSISNYQDWSTASAYPESCLQRSHNRIHRTHRRQSP